MLNLKYLHIAEFRLIYIIYTPNLYKLYTIHAQEKTVPVTNTIVTII